MIQVQAFSTRTERCSYKDTPAKAAGVSFFFATNYPFITILGSRASRSAVPVRINQYDEMCTAPHPRSLSIWSGKNCGFYHCITLVEPMPTNTRPKRAPRKKYFGPEMALKRQATSVSFGQ